MMDFLKRMFAPERSSETAKERLRLVLLSDHLSLAPDVVEALKRDLLEVISRYVEIDPATADVSFEHRDTEVAMLANIPITGVRERTGRAATSPDPLPPRAGTATLAASAAPGSTAVAPPAPAETSGSSVPPPPSPALAETSAPTSVPPLSAGVPASASAPTPAVPSNVAVVEVADPPRLPLEPGAAALEVRRRASAPSARSEPGDAIPGDTTETEFPDDVETRDGDLADGATEPATPPETESETSSMLASEGVATSTAAARRRRRKRRAAQAKLAPQ